MWKTLRHQGAWLVAWAVLAALTAVLANTQAARRLLDEDPPELDTARHAMAQAAEQARRASTVLGRLRLSLPLSA